MWKHQALPAVSQAARAHQPTCISELWACPCSPPHPHKLTEIHRPAAEQHGFTERSSAAIVFPSKIQRKLDLDVCDDLGRSH